MINSYKGIFGAINLTATYHEKRWGHGYRSNSYKIQVSTEQAIMMEWWKKLAKKGQPRQHYKPLNKPKGIKVPIAEIRKVEVEQSGLGRAGTGAVVLPSDILNLLSIGQPISAVSQTGEDTGLERIAEQMRRSRKGKRPSRVPTWFQTLS